MSFIDLATLALHRRNEMESRINVFVTKCDKATHDILKLKMKAQGFVNQLNCDPSELKDRFLQCMRTLDEYMYLITDFNLSIGKLEEITGNTTIEPPVHDTSGKKILQTNTSLNIMDILCEAGPSTSTMCPNLCPVEHKPKKIIKEEQSLITFSSNSCSSESMPLTKTELEKKYMKNINDTMQKLQIKEPPSPPLEKLSLPAQTVLQTDTIYPGVIMHIDGPSLWIITDDANEFCNFMSEMTEYYKANTKEIKMKDFNTLTYCVYHCDDDNYFRALLIRPTEGAGCIALSEVFLVDTGEVRPLGELSKLRPLSARFCLRPPSARCCHLAGVDLLRFDNKDMADKQKEFLHQYVGMRCFIEVDDNTSESLGVYVILDEKETLNDLAIRGGWAKSTEKCNPIPPVVLKANSIATSQSDNHSDTLTDCPEYEDPVEAVTGYSNRDEAEICKHYKGGSEKTCYKGQRCKKRHVLMHPEGWTLDQVSVAGRVEEAELPAPGTWRRALVSFVCHYDRLYVQLRNDDDQEPLPLPEFGVVIPPRNLDELVKDMNSSATRTSYKRLKMMPAPGELVAALYVDECWYRARILSYSRSDQNIEVMYIDYGNQVWVREENVRVLPERLCGVRAQATRCALAGVVAVPGGHDVAKAAKQLLNNLALDKLFDLRVIARDYDEITVELFDEKGNNLAEKLAESKLVTLKEVSVVDDTSVTKKVVVP